MEDIAGARSFLAAWQHLGIDQRIIEVILDGASENADLWLIDCPGVSPETNEKVKCWADDNELNCTRLFGLGCSGFVGFRPQFEDWRRFAMRMPGVAIEYFFGPWRDDFKRFGYDPYDRLRARKELPWMNNYRAGLSIAASFSDWASFDRLLEWPGLDLPFDEGVDDRVPEDCAFHIWLAMTLRGQGDLAEVQRQKVKEGSRRRPRMLMATAEAILAGDVEAMRREMTTYLKYYLKNEFRPKQVDLAVARDANILWHVARRRGMGEVVLPEDVFFLIGRP